MNSHRPQRSIVDPFKIYKRCIEHLHKLTEWPKNVLLIEMIFFKNNTVQLQIYAYNYI